MRADADVAVGAKAKVTLSFAAWKDGRVTGATLEAPVTAAPANANK